MKPVAILSTDTNPDYLFCLPIVAKSWQLQGFDVDAIVFCSDVNDRPLFLNRFLSQPFIAAHKYTLPASQNKSILVQCIRLYTGSQFEKGRYSIIGDVDMFIGSDFLNRDFEKLNVFGHDLTGFNEVPMCYVGMPTEKWAEIFGSIHPDFRNDLEKYSKYKSDIWHEAWGADQQILTAKLKEYGFDKINFISRGTDPANHNLPLGRWDRYGGFKRPAGQVHDVHLPRQPYSDENFPKIVAMCMDLYPNEDWGWMDEYRKEFLIEFARKIFS